MKKTKAENDNELRPQYDLRALLKSGVRGRYYRATQSGYTITVHKEGGTTTVRHVNPPKGSVVLEPDVQEFFPDSESVNNALRSLIPSAPSKRHAKSAKGKSVRGKRKSFPAKQRKSLRS